LSTQLKLALGDAGAAQVEIEACIRHWREHDVGFAAQLRDVLSTHPGLHARIDKMVDFAHSGSVEGVASR